MLAKYMSEFRNQVHQLNVCLSKHYFLLKDGSIKWQSKAFDIDWRNYKGTGRRHLVTFIVRDHYSNCFYAELHSVESMPTISQFLFNAWSHKDHFPFSGVPSCLIVPSNTQSQFPSILKFLSTGVGPSLQTPTSGFSSAVVSIRKWERFIKFLTWQSEDIKTLAQFQENIQLINYRINAFGSSKTAGNSLQKWMDNTPKLVPIADKNLFFSLFD